MAADREAWRGAGPPEDRQTVGKSVKPRTARANATARATQIQSSPSDTCHMLLRRATRDISIRAGQST